MKLAAGNQDVMLMHSSLSTVWVVCINLTLFNLNKLPTVRSRVLSLGTQW